MLNFNQYIQESKLHKEAEKKLHDASYRASLGDHSKQVRMKQMGFKVVDDHESMEHARKVYRGEAKSKHLGEIPIPSKVTQDEVDKEKAKSMIINHTKLPPIKVAKVNGEHVVVDGHHRLAAAKALGKKTISADIVN
jgi:FKBP-type peptidyl-prolyl cis-trans isomerase 2